MARAIYGLGNKRSIVNDVSVESSNTLMNRPPIEHQTLITPGDDRAPTLKQTTVHSNLSLSDQSKTHKRSGLPNQSSSYNNLALLRYVQTDQESNFTDPESASRYPDGINMEDGVIVDDGGWAVFLENNDETQYPDIVTNIALSQFLTDFE